MNVRIIIQARTTSTRLPGKALLPIAGYPAAILAALRGANRNTKIIFATSDDPSDDRLAADAKRHSLEVFRGPLHDVLARYWMASADLPDDAIVVRLTGDNVVPDGSFVNQLVEALQESRAEYLGVTPDVSGLPYGVFGEAFYVAALRKAHLNATEDADREHVGPWMKRNCKAAEFQPTTRSENWATLRGTIDTWEDYRQILMLFHGLANPLAIGWRDLTRKLASLPVVAKGMQYRNIQGTPYSEFTLGTAQLGMAYGRVNSSGKPSRTDAVSMVASAFGRGVNAFDTARAYQDSESVLGEALNSGAASSCQIITKIDLSMLGRSAEQNAVRGQVDSCVASSRQALKRERLDTVLLHYWEHRNLWSGAAWERLEEHCESGTVRSIGASVYEPNQALEALGDERLQHLQIPMNLLDWRWKAAGVDRAIADRPDVIVHARSALLQGILAHPAERWPEVAGFDAGQCVLALQRLLRKFGRNSVCDLCFAYVRSLPWITSVVVGCETLTQLEQNLDHFLQPKLTSEECEELERAFPRAPEALLNPAKWTAASAWTAAYAS